MLDRREFIKRGALAGIGVGLMSIAGGVYSTVRLVNPGPAPGEVVATVHEAGSDRPVSQATVEILAPDDTLVMATTTTASGIVARSLREGVYRLRVSAPPLAEATRDVRIQPGATTEVRFALAAKASATARRSAASGPVESATRAVGKGVSGVERFVHRLGL